MNWQNALASASLGVAAFFLTRVVWELITARMKETRFLRALCVDAAGSIRAMTDFARRFNENSRRLRATNWREQLSKLDDGWVFDQPIPVAAFIDSFGRDYAYLAILYRDRWNRLVEIERRYATLFSKLLDVESPQKQKDEDTRTRLRQCVDLMLRLSLELRIISAYIVAASYQRSAFLSWRGESLQDHSEREWSELEGLSKSLDEFSTEYRRLYPEKVDFVERVNKKYRSYLKTPLASLTR